MTTATNARAPIVDERVEDLRWAISLVEDWLLHASTETLDELADFAYGPAQHGHNIHGHNIHDQLRWIIDLLGEASIWLRPPPPTQPATTADDTADDTADRGPGR
jgi:hypothetical protein